MLSYSKTKPTGSFLIEDTAIAIRSFFHLVTGTGIHILSFLKKQRSKHAGCEEFKSFVLFLKRALHT